MPQDAPEGSKWLSYGELANARQISKASAIRLARRRKWVKRRGNDGGVRVAIPEGEDEPKGDNLRDDLRDAPEDNRQDDREDNHVDNRISRITKAFETAVTSLTERAVAAERRADTAENRAAQAEARAQLVEADAHRWWAQSRWRRAWSGWRGR
jgi:hypothetical protein